jgi:hypothetical protein
MNINLRVFRRTLDNIVLLWDSKELTEDQKKNLRICVAGGTINDSQGTVKVVEEPLKFLTSVDIKNVVEDKITVPDTTVVAIINHAENNLDSSKGYNLSVHFDTLSFPVKVFPFGVLPGEEKDKKDANVHIYGWVEGKKRWFKLPLVKTKDGSYALAVKIVE